MWKYRMPRTTGKPKLCETDPPMIFTQKELVGALPHIAFEFFHFRFYSRLLNDGSLQRCSAGVRQAVGYSLLLHFRVLWNFFYERATMDDCTASHFKVFPTFAAAFPKSMKPDRAAGLSKNLNKRLAHLTATRWRERPPAMSFYQGYFHDIEAHMTAFEEALPTELKSSFAKTTRSFELRYRDRL